MISLPYLFLGPKWNGWSWPRRFGIHQKATIHAFLIAVPSCFAFIISIQFFCFGYPATISFSPTASIQGKQTRSHLDQNWTLPNICHLGNSSLFLQEAFRLNKLWLLVTFPMLSNEDVWVMELKLLKNIYFEMPFFGIRRNLILKWL